MSFVQALAEGIEYNKKNIMTVIVAEYQNGSFGWHDITTHPYLKNSIKTQIAVIHPTGYIHITV